MSFTNTEVERYARQILVRDFGGAAQARLKSAHVAVIGAGGVGSPVLLYLVAAGIGKFTLFEDDQVALSNLQRQVLFGERDIGYPKSESAKDRLSALNSDCDILLAGRFDGSTHPKADLLIDGSDQFAVRQLANQKAAQWAVPLLSVSLAQWEGQIAHYDPARALGCYQCLYPEGTDLSQIPSCSEAGVIGAVAGVIGTLAALEAIKILADIQPLKPREMLVFDGLYRELRTMRITPRAGCAVCGGTD